MKKNRRRLNVIRSEDQKSEKRRGNQHSTPVPQPRASDDRDTNAASAPTLIASLPVVWVVLATFFALAAVIWSYWPTWTALVAVWNREPDYSHGWFVIPITIYLLWSSRDAMPRFQSGFHLGGLVFLGIVVLMRAFSRWAYFDFMDGWTIPLSAIALAWVFCGRSWTGWALPALVFLFFMIPLPFRLENELSRPLQFIATNLSCYSLQLLGQPAIAEGTTILLGDQQLEVERACSGLRIFMGVFALAYVYAFLVKRVWWERVIFVLAAIPIALISNATRIVVTGFFYQWFEGETARRFTHDWAGFAMIAFAGGLFGLLLFYMRCLVRDTESLDQLALQRV